MNMNWGKVRGISASHEFCHSELLFDVGLILIRYLRKRLLGCFHTEHTHPLGFVDVPFWGLLSAAYLGV